MGTLKNEGMANINDVRKYFGMTMAEFKEEWTKLDADSKAEIRTLVLAEIAE